MAFLRECGRYLPERVVSNEELAPMVGESAAWMQRVSGIMERRYAAEEQSVADLAVLAAEDCLRRAGMRAEELGMVLVASGSSERFCPGPASSVAMRLGLSSTPALDVPVASAGSLMAMAMAMRFAPHVGIVLVIGAEIMSRRVDRTPGGKNTAILFGDGAGAFLVDPGEGFLHLADAALYTDGSGAEALYMEGDRLHMDGGSVILRASRKLPAAIGELLSRNAVVADAVGTVLMHQANLNLMTKVASSAGIAADRCFVNIDRYGNTSSASLPIAMAEWRLANPGPVAAPVVFAAFGAGLNWGAVLGMPPGRG